MNIRAKVAINLYLQNEAIRDVLANVVNKI